MKSNWGKVGHLFPHAAITRRLSFLKTCKVGVSESHVIHLAYLQRCRRAAGQRATREQVGLFTFDGYFLGGKEITITNQLIGGVH